MVVEISFIKKDPAEGFFPTRSNSLRLNPKNNLPLSEIGLSIACCQKIRWLETLEYPKVSIIILNWNGWRDTIECLESLYQITYPNYEVIVVDNASEKKVKNTEDKSKGGVGIWKK